MARGDSHNGGQAGTRPAVLDDSELKTTVFSPVCTFCAYWKPTDGHHCDAYPRGNTPQEKTPAIPQPIWDGAPGEASAYYHTRAYGDEAKDAQGNPILFEKHPAAQVNALPAGLRTAWLARERARQIEKQSQP